MYIKTNYLMFSVLGVIIDFFDCMIEYICCGHRGLRLPLQCENETITIIDGWLK